jgi:hypothetical protein
VVSIERTLDIGTVRSIFAGDPALYDKISDDGSPPPGEFIPLPGGLYLAAVVDEVVVGLFMFVPVNAVSLDAHFCFPVPGYATEGSVNALDWIWSNTLIERVVASIPITNRAAILIAHRAGMEDIGINKKSLLKNGELVDQLILGVSRCQE